MTIKGPQKNPKAKVINKKSQDCQIAVLDSASCFALSLEVVGSFLNILKQENMFVCFLGGEGGEGMTIINFESKEYRVEIYSLYR